MFDPMISKWHHELGMLHETDFELSMTCRAAIRSPDLMTLTFDFEDASVYEL